MRQIIQTLLFIILTTTLMAQDLTDIKVCIDPGHGGHESDDRHILATDFWESEGNLTKAKELDTILSSFGAEVLLTRYGNNGTSDDPSLSQRVAIANSYGADYFHSIHSNGFNGTSNYTLMLYREENGSPAWPEAVEMCNIMKDDIREAHRTTAAYTRGDYTFLGFNLGVLSGLNTVGTLSEGSFHDYIPESWRLQNLDYRKHESWAIARSFLEYFTAGNYGVGEIAGVIRNYEQLVDYFFISGTSDAKQPLNGVKVTLTPGDQLQFTDHQNNGFFLFDSLSPGMYKVVFEANNFDKDSVEVEVTANRTVFADRYLFPDSNYIAPPITPENIQVISVNDSSLRIDCSISARADSYVVLISEDGVTFSDSALSDSNSISVTGLEENTPYYFKLKAKNESGVSALTKKVYGGAPSSSNMRTLVVNGFDRSTNTRNDYVRFYGNPITSRGHGFSYCLNEEVFQGRILLKEYNAVIWISGDESTADDTFNPVEQDSIESFLKAGGFLFVSGSEIGWDLVGKADHPTQADKDFYHNYLKAEYIDDAPDGTKDVYYSCEPISGQMFEDLPPFSFDNGTNGTINVRYPDAINGINGAKNILKYKFAPSKNIAGTAFEGVFPGGSEKGKVVYFGFPFEAIYPLSSRIQAMEKVYDFFEGTISDIGLMIVTPSQFELSQNYPNPFNPLTQIAFSLATAAKTELNIYNAIGQKVKTLIHKNMQAGSYQVQFNAENLASGVYIYELKSGKNTMRKRMILLK